MTQAVFDESDIEPAPDTEPSPAPYPSRAEFSDLVGRVDANQTGLAALEKKVDEEKKNREVGDKAVNENVTQLRAEVAEVKDIAVTVKGAVTGFLSDPLTRYALIAIGVGLWWWLKSKGVNLPTPEVFK